MEQENTIDVWLISTKTNNSQEDILNGLLFNHDNSISEDIYEDKFDKPLTLKHFYYDVLATKKVGVKTRAIDKFFLSGDLSESIPKNNRDDIKKIMAQFSNDEIKSSLNFDKVYCFRGNKEQNEKSENYRVFLTRCFPHLLSYSLNRAKPKEGEPLSHCGIYWLYAYMNTVACILNQPIENIKFNFVLHDKDIISSSSDHKKHYKYELEKKDFDRLQQDKDLELGHCYLFTHDPSDNYYTRVISNKNFFKGCETNEEAVKKLEFFFSKKNDHENAIREMLKSEEGYCFDDSRIELKFGIRNNG